MHATTDLDPALLRLRALGDPRRLRILAELAGGERCVCDLMDALDAGQSLLSFHLKTLRDAGLVHDRRAGRWVYYSIDAAGLAALEDFLRTLREAALSSPAAGSACCD